MTRRRLQDERQLLSEVIALLRDKELGAQAKRSTSALVVQDGDRIFKILDPSRVGDASTRVDHWISRVQHERAATGMAMRVATSSSARCAELLGDEVVIDYLCELGFGVESAISVSRFVLAFEWCHGEAIGHYSDELGAYVVDRTVVDAYGQGNLTRCLQDLRVFLNAANQAGVFHNDLAPQNVLFALGDGGTLRARVVDYGASYIDLPGLLYQPRVPYIEDWYASRIHLGQGGLPGIAGRLRGYAVSKDLFDLKVLQALIRFS